MTPQTAIKLVAQQMGVPATHLFESVLRDPQDRRRLYLTFKSLKVKQKVVETGFKLGNVTIKPSDGSLSGYIPFPPFYVDSNSLVTALSRHGQVIESTFICTSDGIRVAGFRFRLKLHHNAVAPREFRYGDTLMQIRYDDDLRTCTFCGNSGHTVRFCRKRVAAGSGPTHDSPTTQDPSRAVPATVDAAPDSCDDATGADKTAPSSATSPALRDPAAADSSASVHSLPPALTVVERLWHRASDALERDEDITLHELLFHLYCRLTALNDTLEECITNFRRKGIPESTIAFARDVAREIATAHTEEWQKEWLDTRIRFFENRVADHAALVEKGLPPAYRIHPAGRDGIPVVPDAPDFTSVQNVDDARVLDYISRLGFIAESHRLLLAGLREVIALPTDDEGDSPPSGDAGLPDSTAMETDDPAPPDSVVCSQGPMATTVCADAKPTTSESPLPLSPSVLPGIVHSASEVPEAVGVDADVLVTTTESSLPSAVAAVSEPVHSAPVGPEAVPVHVDVIATPTDSLQRSETDVSPPSSDSPVLPPPAVTTSTPAAVASHFTSTDVRLRDPTAALTVIRENVEPSDSAVDFDRRTYTFRPKVMGDEANYRGYPYFVSFRCALPHPVVDHGVLEAMQEVRKKYRYSWMAPRLRVFRKKDEAGKSTLYHLYLPSFDTCRAFIDHVEPLLRSQLIPLTELSSILENTKFLTTGTDSGSSVISD